MYGDCIMCQNKKPLRLYHYKNVPDIGMCKDCQKAYQLGYQHGETKCSIL